MSFQKSSKPTNIHDSSLVAKNNVRDLKTDAFLLTLPMATLSNVNVSIVLTRTVFVCISRLLAAYRNSEAGVLHLFLHVKF